MKNTLVAAMAHALVLVSPTAWSVGIPPPGSIEAGTLSVPAGPGSLRGIADSASLDAFSAQIAYSVPLQLGAGPGGVTPQLALRYDGALGNGHFGIGWSLELPVLRRSTRLGVPSYGPSDELELVGVSGGGVLVPAADGTYRIRGRGQAIKIAFAPFASSAVVTDSDGVQYLMGFSASSRVMEGSRIFAWYVQQIVHPSGERITFQYQRDNGQLELASVQWGPGGAYGLQLQYETRPDIFTSYRSGFRVETRRRVTSLDVFSFGTMTRRYVLTYADSAPLSRLARVEQRGRNGQGALPAVTLHYGSSAPARAEEISGTGGWSLSNPDVTLLDIDADGLADLVNFGGGQHLYRRNLGTSFAAPATILSDIPGSAPGLGSLRLMDVRGAARPEMVRIVGSQWQVHRLDTAAWSTVGTWVNSAGVPLSGAGIAFADVNGDRRTDVLKSVASSIQVQLAQDEELGAPVIHPAPAAGVLPGGAHVAFHDATGDGLADAIVLHTINAHVYSGFGDGRFGAPVTIQYPVELVTAQLDDLRLGDLNNDGVVDFIRVTAQEVLWFPMRPGGVFMTDAAGQPVIERLPRPTGVAFDAKVAIADGNGNGSQDIIWSAPTGLWVLDLAGPTTAAMLTQVDNGTGAEQSFSYRPSSILALEAELDPLRPDWTDRLHYSIPVPVTVEQSLASGGPDRRVDIEVRDAFWDDDDQRFGGFQRIVRTSHGDDARSTLVEDVAYERGLGVNRVLRGKPTRVERRDGDGRLLDVTVNVFEAYAVSGLPSSTPGLRRPVLSLQRRLIHEGSSSPKELVTEFSFDADGNPTVEQNYGDVTVKGDERIVYRTFATSPARWVRDREVETRVTDDAGTTVAWTRSYFDGLAQPLPFGQVDKGWLRRTEGWLESERRWVALTEFDYDAFGNTTRSREGALTRELTYDSYNVTPVMETVRANSSTSLSWRVLAYDYGLGVPLEVEDPNGVRRQLTYDSLGRMVELALAGQPPYARYDYDWSSPRPSSTTFLDDGPGKQRESWQVHNSLGEALYEGVRTGAGTWSIHGYTQRDFRGMPRFVAEPFSSGTPTVASAPAVPGTSLEHDALGRVLQAQGPDGATRIAQYAPLRTTSTVRGLAAVERTFDGLGRLIRTERQLSSGPETTIAAYDAVDRLTSLDLQRGRAVHSFGYDTLGRLRASADPDGGPLTYAYYDSGLVREIVNGEGQRVTIDYDDVGRPLDIKVAGNSVFAYEYDIGAPADHGRGRVGRIYEPSGQITLAYDAQGRVRRRDRSIHGRTFWEVSEFSPSGLLTRRSYDDGFSVDYGYDRAGRLESMGNYWVATSRDAAGRLLEAATSNGLTELFSRDVLGDPDRITTTGPAGPLLDLEIVRAPFRAPIKVTDRDGVGLGHSADYGYDDAGRLVQASVGGHTFDYAFDGLQNLVRRDATPAPAVGLFGAYSYGGSAGPRQLNAANGVAFRYDRAGRLIDDGSRTMVYDAFDRLVHLSTSGGAFVQYEYGQDGEQSYSIDNTGQQEYRFAPEVVERGGQRTYYLEIDGRPKVRVDWSKGGVLFFSDGASAGAAVLTDHTGAVVEERVYGPYGALLAGQRSADAHGGGGKPIDVRTGLADHGARWLDARIGRWHAPDPILQSPANWQISEPWRLNPYQYAQSNPMAFWDPDGREEQSTVERDLRGDHPLGGKYDGPTAETLLFKEVHGVDRKIGGNGVTFKLEDGRDGQQVQMTVGRYTVGKGDSEFNRLPYQDSGRAKLEFRLGEVRGGKSSGVDPKIDAKIGVAADMVEDHTRGMVRARLELYFQVTGSASLQTRLPGVQLSPKQGVRLVVLRLDSRVAMHPERPLRYVRSPGDGGGGLGRTIARAVERFEHFIIRLGRD